MRDQPHDPWRWMQRLTQALSLGAFALTVGMGVGTGRVPTSSSAEDLQGRHRAAMADYQAGRWNDAWPALADLADDGDVEAARVAGLMARQGPVLYGHVFEASAERQAAWARVAGVPATHRHPPRAQPVRLEGDAIAER